MAESFPTRKVGVGTVAPSGGDRGYKDPITPFESRVGGLGRANFPAQVGRDTTDWHISASAQVNYFVKASVITMMYFFPEPVDVRGPKRSM